jgi:hypothetical protein
LKEALLEMDDKAIIEARKQRSVNASQLSTNEHEENIQVTKLAEPTVTKPVAGGGFER